MTDVTEAEVHRAYAAWGVARKGAPLSPGEYEATFSRVEFAWMRCALAARNQPAPPTREELAAVIADYLPGADGPADSRTIASAVLELFHRG